jgi:hypothetical protein
MNIIARRAAKSPESSREQAAGALHKNVMIPQNPGQTVSASVYFRASNT